MSSMYKHSPEALSLAALGRADSKRPDKTCRGITSDGKPCRKPLKKGSQEKYCHLHREQQWAEPPPLQFSSASRLRIPPPTSINGSKSIPQQAKRKGPCKLGRVIRKLFCIAPQDSTVVQPARQPEPKFSRNEPPPKRYHPTTRSGLPLPNPPDVISHSRHTPQSAQNLPRLPPKAVNSRKGSHVKGPLQSRSSAPVLWGPSRRMWATTKDIDRGRETMWVPGVGRLGTYIICKGITFGNLN
jgi:hypothetical protein